MPLPLPPMHSEDMRPALVFRDDERIPEAVLMIERARACRDIARQIVQARRESGLTVLQAARRIGMDWRVVHNIEASGMLLLPDEELGDLWEMIDIATALGRRVAFELVESLKLSRTVHIERALGMRPYGTEFTDDGPRHLYARRASGGTEVHHDVIGLAA